MNTTEIYTKQKRKYPNTKRKTTKNGEHDTQKRAEKCSFMKIYLTAIFLFRSSVCVSLSRKQINNHMF